MIKYCLLCNSAFETTNSNKDYCSLVHRNEYRNRFRQRAYSVKYASKDPKTFISRLLLKRRYNKHQLSLDYLMFIYNKQKGLCALSGVEMTYQHGEGYISTNMSIDRIDPQVGYIPGNVQLVCRVVNIMKYVSSTDDLLVWCKRIVNYNLAIELDR